MLDALALCYVLFYHAAVYGFYIRIIDIDISVLIAHADNIGRIKPENEYIRMKLANLCGYAVAVKLCGIEKSGIHAAIVPVVVAMAECAYSEMKKYAEFPVQIFDLISVSASFCCSFREGNYLRDPKRVHLSIEIKSDFYSLHDGIIQFHVVKFNGKIAFSVIKSKM